MSHQKLTWPKKARDLHGQSEHESTNSGKTYHNTHHNHPRHKKIQSLVAVNCKNQHYRVLVPRMSVLLLQLPSAGFSADTGHNTMGDKNQLSKKKTMGDKKVILMP